MGPPNFCPLKQYFPLFPVDLSTKNQNWSPTFSLKCPYKSSFFAKLASAKSSLRCRSYISCRYCCLKLIECKIHFAPLFPVMQPHVNAMAELLEYISYYFL